MGPILARSDIILPVLARSGPILARSGLILARSGQISTGRACLGRPRFGKLWFSVRETTILGFPIDIDLAGLGPILTRSGQILTVLARSGRILARSGPILVRSGQIPTARACLGRPRSGKYVFS